MLLRIAITMGVASFVTTSAPAMMQHDNVFRGAVTRILDGDTFEVRGHRRRIMLSGTDAPEPGEKGYSRSRETLRRLIGGKPVSCRQIAIDKYGRTVARCWNSKGREVNRQMVKLKAAREWCYFSKGRYGTC